MTSSIFKAALLYGPPNSTDEKGNGEPGLDGGFGAANATWPKGPARGGGELERRVRSEAHVEVRGIGTLDREPRRSRSF